MCIDLSEIKAITKFAQLELHYGEKSRGKTMLDQTVNKFPKRVDLWLLYANQLISLNDYDGAR